MAGTDYFTPPEVDEIIDRCKTYVKGELKTLNPTDQNSLIYSLIVALANLSNDNNMQIKLDILPNSFPQHCKTDESLNNFAYIKNVPRTQPSSASGLAVIQGTEGGVIPLNASFLANNKTYKTGSTVEISEYSIALTSLSVNGTLVTATTASNHNLASNITVNISGATNNILNGDFVISVNGLNSFTYNISEETTTEETENLLAKAMIGILEMKSVETGSDTNLSNGDALAIENKIDGVSDNAYTQFSGISGGSDIQPFNEWKDIVVDRYRNPITYFNENNIKNTAKSVAGVTKVWVKSTYPTVGQCTVYFIRGNDENVIPDANEVQIVANKIKALSTVKDDKDDTFVLAPTAKTVNFNFSEIVPNTPNMRTAIQNSLKQLFEDEADLEKNMTEDDYRTAIKNSFDMETGTKLQSFALTAPIGDITVGLGELPVLGDVTFL